ncbi:SRPBCC family protein [Nocardiopsis trehalosi]|jgi:aromatase|uniref:SRPBCC family protein n=1 Tax=Nocardiopsis trehalosi TaxID=109329 RepID=UPI0008379E78|nr:SRPBCC family protein [Nocardiopsis trehalosi]
MSGHTDNAITIDAPMDLVWRMANDVPSWPELFTEYAAAEVLHRDGDRVRFRLTTVPDENGASQTWVSERLHDPAARTVRAQRIELGPFKYMHLFWEFTPDGDGVRLRWVQDFEVRDDAPFDDAAVAARLNRLSPVQMRHIRAAIESAARAAEPVDAGA